MTFRKHTERTPARQRASWNSACDAILLECLEREQADGRMTSNGSFHEDAWKAAEKALAGTEAHSGVSKSQQIAANTTTRW